MQTDPDAVLAALGELMAAHPHDEPVRLVSERTGGLDRVLDAVLARICAGFEPGRTRGEGGVFHYRVSIPDGYADRFVTVADERYTVSRTGPVEPETTVTVAFADICRLALGRTTGSAEFRAGRLVITGDIYFAMNFSDWFGAVDPAPGR